MIVTGLEPAGKGREKVFLDGNAAFVLYGGELSRYGIREDAEVSEELYERILKEVLLKRAQARSLYILKSMDKTEALSANLREINPYVSLTAHDLRLTAENAALLLEQADIICEAFDDPVQKSMLANTVLERLPSAYLVAASGMAGIASANDIKTRRISERFYLCGDGVSDSAEKPGLLSARVALCAAHQAHMVLRLLAGFKEP